MQNVFMSFKSFVDAYVLGHAGHSVEINGVHFSKEDVEFLMGTERMHIHFTNCVFEHLPLAPIIRRFSYDNCAFKDFEAGWVEGTRMLNCTFERIKFSSTTISCVRMYNTKFVDCTFEDIHIFMTEVDEVDFYNCNIGELTTFGNTFVNVSFYGTTIKHAQITSAKLSLQLMADSKVGTAEIVYDNEEPGTAGHIIVHTGSDIKKMDLTGHLIIRNI